MPATKLYVTFGLRYAREEHPACPWAHPDGWLTVNAPTPFMGVGSEVYVAVTMGRFGIGAELKSSYYRQAVANLATIGEDRDAAPALLEIGGES